MNCIARVPCSGWVEAASPDRVKELNFVFLHGRGATSADTQLLADTLEELALPYIYAFNQVNPDTAIKINILQRSYPNDVDAETWAKNIGDAVAKHFADKRDLILIGHSMGGKAALYGAAHNIGNLGDLTKMVVTINSPIKNLNSFYVVGGGTVTDYIRKSMVISDKGMAESIGSYDSSSDGLQIGTKKHWLAFISAESAPISSQFDYSGVDPFPKDMDDGAVPISAQSSAGADVVYYGEKGHGDFTNNPEVAAFIADQILRYLFGGTLETPVLLSVEAFEHRAGWVPLTYHWDDRFGESPGPSGVISHTNGSFFRWQEWEDVVSGCSPGHLPGSYRVQLNSLPLLTAVNQVRWLNPGDSTDCQLYVKTRAAPKSHVRAHWEILQHPPLPPGVKRDHYEIKVKDGTSLVGVPQASWLTSNAADTRLEVRSQAEGPFRWFKAEVQVFRQQTIQRKLIDDIISQTLAGCGQ